MAKFDAYLQGAYLQGANLWDAHLRGADLEGAYLKHSKLQDAKLQDANLWDARNLTQKQLDDAYGDDRTKLPDGLTRPAHWSKAEATEDRPAIQPDDAERRPPASGTTGSDK